jgi:hypothetical protein
VITLENRIIRIRDRSLWQWTISVLSWPVRVGCTDADQIWFAECALKGHQ